ncbi:hypothetical protein JOB18_000752 [Solea senegalensis]|uniref:2,3-cyclic-nucleotide 3-phosphodiesterase n=1 Tax=Solea senegalensis TaxID=28829 RepID=A0AAV6RFZ9_SOLSE|nr:2',3'-cyclic-nucleotide 3'-phosphodiesterase [Solea senegalensis]KAG7504114.1 2,3-cyclic-nucleotide 3-phosphodiesterase [Solea senegalensis]KAG7504115.1 hypothetical protein JOB18_000752 [Solea senegalensis]
MDTETSGEVLDASETPQPEETKMEREVESKVETPEESTEPEKPPAAAEETEQLAVNGHDTEVVNFERTEVAIVTENVTSSEEKADGDSVPKDQSDIEVVPAVVATSQPDESAEKISDPVAALATESENITLEQQPVPENNPEALSVQMPLAESAPVPEPEKLAESVPEAEIQQQTLPEPVAMEQPVDMQPPGPEENLPEQVEAKVEEQPAEETTKVEEAEKNVAAEPTSEGQEEKPAETVQVPEVSSENPTEEKSVESETVKGAEAAVAAEVVETEKKETDLEKEEDVVPASGSLSFALLEREQTKETLRTSRTLVVLRGLPGSGKSFLARAIADAYKDHCSVICADDHGVKPENAEPSADGYKALDEAVVTCCSAGTASPLLIVVDDINHSQDRLARLGEIAQEHQLVAIFLEPKTTWSRDAGQLSKKTRRGLEEATLEAMKSPFEEMSIPLFFGWFLLSVQEKVKCTSMDFLKTLDTLEIFKKHMTDFTDKPENEVDLEQYFKDKGVLHCTTKFCDYGKAKGAKEYAQNTAVKDFYGSTFELSLTALFVTPRTVGAKVSLTEEQLLLWPADAESSVPAAASLPLGSRAHITLGCAEGVEPVQTGLDLLDISILQHEGQKGEQVEMELGQLTYFGDGRWFLSLTEPIFVPACFSSFYMRKESESAKKESEKKKKQKCAIL